MKPSKSLSWKNRNNSANITAILHPDYYYNNRSSSTTTLLEENGNKTTNYCYCREYENLRPKLFQHPLEYYQKQQQQQQQQKRYHYGTDQNDELTPRISTHLINNLKESQKFYKEACIERDFVDRTPHEAVSSPPPPPSTPSDRQHLNDLETFRRSHYFETHSTDDLLETIPDHTCTHRFTLNQRQLPVALHTDQFGLSRCIVCNQPMLSSRLDKTFDKNQIYLGNDDNIKIELVLDDDNNDVDNDDNNNIVEGSELVTQPTRCCGTNRFKRPQYCNTLALRYQKGVGWP